MDKKEKADSPKSAPNQSTNNRNCQQENTPEPFNVKDVRKFIGKRAIEKLKADEARQIQLNKQERAEETLDQLNKLFAVNGDPVYVPCITGTKKPMVPWAQLDADNWMANGGEIFAALLAGGNLAIKLGVKGLRTIDLDDDEHVRPFLACNPAFKDTLRTRGSKGCQFWFYCQDAPAEVQKLEISGQLENGGEFRGGKALSTIWGRHPNGNAYQFLVEEPPITIEKFADIQWPENWKLIKPRNNFEYKGERRPNYRRTAKHKKGRIDWPRFNAAMKNGDGHKIVQSLVDRWFPECVLEGEEWSCGDISGRAQNNKGSCHIHPDGFIVDFDGSWNRSSIINAITSDYRVSLTGEEVTEADIFNGIIEDTGLDFFMLSSMDKFNSGT